MCFEMASNRNKKRKHTAYEGNITSFDQELSILDDTSEIQDNNGLPLNNLTNDNIGAFSKKINEIHAMVTALSKHQHRQQIPLDDANRSRTKMAKLRLWLNHDLGLGQYYDIFIQNDIEDIDTISSCTMNELYDLGIKSFGHRKKILNEAAKLIQQNKC